MTLAVIALAVAVASFVFGVATRLRLGRTWVALARNERVLAATDRVIAANWDALGYPIEADKRRGSAEDHDRLAHLYARKGRLYSRIRKDHP